MRFPVLLLLLLLSIARAAERPNILFIMTDDHAPNVIADLGFEWLGTRLNGKPLFLMLHHKAPHRPWEPDEKHRAMFEKRTIAEPGHFSTTTRRGAI